MNLEKLSFENNNNQSPEIDKGKRDFLKLGLAGAAVLGLELSGLGKIARAAENKDELQEKLADIGDGDIAYRQLERLVENDPSERIFFRVGDRVFLVKDKWNKSSQVIDFELLKKFKDRFAKDEMVVIGHTHPTETYLPAFEDNIELARRVPRPPSFMDIEAACLVESEKNLAGTEFSYEVIDSGGVWNYSLGGDKILILKEVYTNHLANRDLLENELDKNFSANEKEVLTADPAIRKFLKDNDVREIINNNFSIPETLSQSHQELLKKFINFLRVKYQESLDLLQKNGLLNMVRSYTQQTSLFLRVKPDTLPEEIDELVNRYVDFCQEIGLEVSYQKNEQ